MYEFDLNNFFEEVSLSVVNYELSKTLGYPEHVVQLLDKLNKSVVKLKDKDEIEEPSRNVLLNSSTQYTDHVIQALKKKGHTPPFLELYEYGEDFYYLYEQESGSEKELTKTKGVPQGAPTSCSLSTLSIDIITNQNRLKLVIKYKDTVVVMYADDGIIFANSLEAIEEIKQLFAKQGVPIKEEKSRLLKKDGI